MSYTAEYTFDDTGWTTVADQASGASSAFVQLREAGPVLVFVGQSAPANDSDVGVMLHEHGLQELSVLALDTDDIVAVRARQDEDCKVIVSAPGTQPGA